MVPFSFAHLAWHVVDGCALFLADEAALIVADLHLEKASWFAMRGQPLPPYDSRATLERLASVIRLSGARRVYALGDNFHDSGGELRLEPHAAGMLSALTRAIDWTWVCGNHDPHISGHWGGRVVGEAQLAGVALRHEIDAGDHGPEISGHFHPCHRVDLRGRSVRRPCFVTDGQRLVVPAFGALTGGLGTHQPALLGAFPGDAPVDAWLVAGGRMLRFPVRHGRAQA